MALIESSRKAHDFVVVGENIHRDYNAQMDLLIHPPEPSVQRRNGSRKEPARREIHSACCDVPGFLDFFAGSGLVAQGLKGHFEAVWANDICEKKAAVYRANHSSDGFHHGSISEVSGRELPVASLAWASFPCQDLSLAGLTGGIHAPRSGLVWEWLRVIDEMVEPPPILVAENVIGLLSSQGGQHYHALHNALIDRGYRVGSVVLDAQRWVPQSRPRVFVIATRQDVVIPPILQATKPTWAHPKVVERAAQGLDEWIWWNLPEPSSRKQRLTDIIEWDAPFADVETDRRNISLISSRHRDKLDCIPETRVFVAPGYRRTRNGKQVLELRFDDVAGCLRTPKGGSSRQVVVIKKDGRLHSRLITTREAARLMGAPESYRLPGRYNDGYKAMGDAVAVPVAKWLAEHLLAPLVKAHGNF